MTRTYKIRGTEQHAGTIPPTSQGIVITNPRRLVPGSARDARNVRKNYGANAAYLKKVFQGV